MLCASCRLRKPGIGWPSSLVRRAEIDERREAQLEACGRVAPGYGDLESGGLSLPAGRSRHACLRILRRFDEAGLDRRLDAAGCPA